MKKYLMIVAIAYLCLLPTNNMTMELVNLLEPDKPKLNKAIEKKSQKNKNQKNYKPQRPKAQIKSCIAKCPFDNCKKMFKGNYNHVKHRLVVHMYNQWHNPDKFEEISELIKLFKKTPAGYEFVCKNCTTLKIGPKGNPRTSLVSHFYATKIHNETVIKNLDKCITESK